MPSTLNSGEPSMNASARQSSTSVPMSVSRIVRMTKVVSFLPRANRLPGAVRLPPGGQLCGGMLPEQTREIRPEGVRVDTRDPAPRPPPPPAVVEAHVRAEDRARVFRPRRPTEQVRDDDFVPDRPRRGAGDLLGRLGFPVEKIAE